MKSHAKRGFTLIELLIVIAIILILIAIALPNFLEAQIRARVTKSLAELRTYQTALESYYLDWRMFPRDHDSAWPYFQPEQNGFTQLTTPLQYLKTLPRDPFGTNVVDTGEVANGVPNAIGRSSTKVAPVRTTKPAVGTLLLILPVHRLPPIMQWRGCASMPIWLKESAPTRRKTPTATTASRTGKVGSSE